MSRPPYALLADIHAHKWSQFSTILPSGVNSRLQIQLNEIDRAADELLDRGGDQMIYAGDLFHVRGQIDPEVFNPTHTTLKTLDERGIYQLAIPGNHDLVGNDTTELGNAFQTLGQIPLFDVITQPCSWSAMEDRVAFVPWCATKNILREKVAKLIAGIDEDSSRRRSETDLIIHAGIDGVLAGVPDRGLSAAEVASWGFKRVFAGDYHNHKIMEDGKVISIGATTHQTWSDIGSKAGFLLVYEDHVEWRASHAPSFVELSGEDDPVDYLSIVDRNYVRVRGLKLTDAEIVKFRKELMDLGAKGVTFQVARETVTARGVAAKSSTLDESVDQFIDKMEDVDIPAVKAEAADVLRATRSVEV